MPADFDFFPQPPPDPMMMGYIWLPMPGMVKIMRSIAMFLLTINPTFIPPRFAILDFRFWI